jgi:1-acyl-sn-glycerol-3-phosphate acyltransferase
MALSPDAAGVPPADVAGRATAHGRGVAFVPNPRQTPGHRVCRAIFRTLLAVWFRPRVSGRLFIPDSGPVILAPVHRSFADFGFAAFVTRRKLFFMAKDDMWSNRWLGRLLITLGAFPVHRESADREALRHAEAVLRAGQVLVLFPEGTRQEGPVVHDLLEGAAFLAARTGAQIVPIGIGNSDRAMPKGQTIPKPLRITVVVGEPLPAPERSGSGRVSRTRVHETTEALRQRIQVVYDRARG